jgi:hypothetical protein
LSILIICEPATTDQIDEIMQTLGSYIKLAVDVGRGLLAGGGELHADCEQALLDDGSQQAEIWGADWYPYTREVGFEALINIRPDSRTLAWRSKTRAQGEG